MNEYERKMMDVIRVSKDKEAAVRVALELLMSLQAEPEKNSVFRQEVF